MPLASDRETEVVQLLFLSRLQLECPHRFARKSRFGRVRPGGGTMKPQCRHESGRCTILLGGSLPAISMKELLEAGVHFGHQTKRWNPKMKEYIFGERNGIYIIDLQKTLKMFKDAARFVGEMAAQGKNVLFVGTKRQAQEAVSEEATRCQMFYVNQRWLGGLLTNMATVQKSIKRLKELEAMSATDGYAGRPKKEIIRLERERKHLDQNLAGIKDMPGLPDVLFVIDSNKEAIAVKEARRLGIPGGGDRRHQLRSRRSGLRDSGQR